MTRGRDEWTSIHPERCGIGGRARDPLAVPGLPVEALWMSLSLLLWRCVLVAFAAILPLAAEDKKVDATAAWLAENYTKHEHRIPMRDGVKLFTRVFVPKDESTNFPVLLTRNLYALQPYGADLYSARADRLRPWRRTDSSSRHRTSVGPRNFLSVISAGIRS